MQYYLSNLQVVNKYPSQYGRKKKRILQRKRRRPDAMTPRPVRPRWAMPENGWGMAHPVLKAPTEKERRRKNKIFAGKERNGEYVKRIERAAAEKKGSFKPD
jgi:hypothetical protein